jgi:hypothetical protein
MLLAVSQLQLSTFRYLLLLAPATWPAVDSGVILLLHPSLAPEPLLPVVDRVYTPPSIPPFH